MIRKLLYCILWYLLGVEVWFFVRSAELDLLVEPPLRTWFFLCSFECLQFLVRNRRAWISSGTGLMHSPYCIKLKWIAPLQNMINICQIQRFNLYCMNLYTHWILPIYLWRKLFPHSKEGLICALNTLLTWKCCRKHEMSWSQPNFLSFPIWMLIWTMYCFSCL